MSHSQRSESCQSCGTLRPAPPQDESWAPNTPHNPNLFAPSGWRARVEAHIAAKMDEWVANYPEDLDGVLGAAARILREMLPRVKADLLESLAALDSLPAREGEGREMRDRAKALIKRVEGMDGDEDAACHECWVARHEVITAIRKEFLNG
jgi:hypothetical protein